MNSELQAELQAELDRLATELGVPGVAVGVLDGETEHEFFTGVASLATGTPVTPDTQFLIGSTSKTFTGTVIMRLIQDGKLSLETHVREILPDFTLADEDATKALQVKHLLTHSGGFLGDMDDREGWGDDAHAKSVADYATVPQFFAPGSVASYSNGGIRLLGRIIEVVTGESFEAVVRRIIFEPLGMTQSFYFPWEIITHPHVIGHKTTEAGVEPATVWGLTRGVAAEGGISSTARDQLRYARFHLAGQADGELPVSDETRLLMQQPHMPAGPPVDAIGYPWLLTHVGDTRIVKHGGNISDQQLSDFVLVPDHDLAITVLTNSAAGKVLGAKLVAWVLEHVRGVVAAAPDFTFVTGDALDAVVGEYDAGQWVNVVTRDGDALQIDMQLRQDLLDLGLAPFPTIPAQLATDDTVVVGGNPAGRLIRNDASDIMFLHFGLRATVRRD